MILLGWALAVLLVLYRIIDIPADGDVPDEVDLSRKVGIFIALIGAAASRTAAGARTRRPRRLRRRPPPPAV